MANKKNAKWAKIALIGGVALVAAGIAWKLLAPKKAGTTSNGAKKVTPPTSPAAPPTNAPSNSGVSYSSGYPIQYGSRGSNVVTLQNALNSFGYGLATDGIFGDKTLAALLDYSGVENVQTPQDLQVIVNAANATGYGTGSMLSNYTATYNPISALVNG